MIISSGWQFIFLKKLFLRRVIISFSYPTSVSGIIVSLKTPTKYGEFFPTLFVKTTDFQLVFNFEQTPTVTVFSPAHV